MLKGITFDNQSATAKNDGGLFKVVGDCFLTDTFVIDPSSNNITLKQGYILAGGRNIFNDANLVVPVNPSLATGFGRLVLKIDLTQTATEETFNQISYFTESASSVNSFRTLVKEDINNDGLIYEVALCYYTLSNSIIGENAVTRDASMQLVTNFAEAPHSFENIKSGTLALRSSANYGTQVPSGTAEEGTLYFKI